MTRKTIPAFLPLMLALCLVIGMLGNLTHFTGVAVVIITLFAFCSVYLLARKSSGGRCAGYTLVSLPA